mgnify:CR=1 FL=1
MPFKRTVLPNGLVLIDSYDITPEEELQMFNDFGGVKLFPSANHRSTINRKKPEDEQPTDGSAMFTHPDTPYLIANLSGLDRAVLHEHTTSGKRFKGLTEKEVANLFL